MYEEAITDMLVEQNEFESGRTNRKTDEWWLMKAYIEVDSEQQARNIAYKHLKDERYFPEWGDYLVKKLEYSELLSYMKSYDSSSSANSSEGQKNTKNRFFEIAEIIFGQ
jgi:hypothetical protein